MFLYVDIFSSLRFLKVRNNNKSNIGAQDAVSGVTNRLPPGGVGDSSNFLGPFDTLGCTLKTRNGCHRLLILAIDASSYVKDSTMFVTSRPESQASFIRAIINTVSNPAVSYVKLLVCRPRVVSNKEE